MKYDEQSNENALSSQVNVNLFQENGSPETSAHFPSWTFLWGAGIF